MPAGVLDYTTQQIVIGHFTDDTGLQIYLNNLDWESVGLNSAPPMVLSLGPNNTLSDITASVFPSGAPEIFWSPRVGAADINEDGYTDIYVADGGADKSPWPGGQAALLLSNGGQNLVHTLHGIPKVKTTNHGFGIGDINGSGHLSILNTALRNITEPGTALLVNNGKTLTNSPSLLPPFLNKTWTPENQGATYTWAAIVDLTGSGRGDVILGQWDNSNTQSLVLLNDGTGNFSKSMPNYLPTTGIAVPVVVQITPIDIFGRGVNDIVLSVVHGGPIGEGLPGYSYPYLQFLKNIGNGQFIDVTETVFPQAKIPTPKLNWDIFVTPVDINCDGLQDLLVQGSSAPGHILLNNKDGTFSKIGEFGSSVVANVAVADVSHTGVFQVIATEQTSWDGPVTGLRIYNTDLPLGNYRYFSGSAAEPNVKGTQFNDIFTPGYGKETFDGLSGIDVIKLTNSSTDYIVAKEGASLNVKHLRNGAIDLTATNVERVDFSNGHLALDTAKGENAGSAYRLYKAAFDRTPDQGGLGFWIDTLDGGTSLTQAAQGFINSAEFKAMYGENATDQHFVTLLYNHVLHRAPEGAGYQFWLDSLASGASRAQVLRDFSESAENIAQTAELVADGIQYQEWLG